jgi:hypothetical protein
MSMMRELENLLREIAEQRRGGGQPAGRYRGSPVDAQSVEPVDLIEPVDAEIVDAEPVHDWRKDNADQPVHRLDTDDLTQHAAHLGAQVGLADEKLEARIHDKFDHDLSKIDDAYADTRRDGGTTEQTAASLDVAEMLRNPQSIRQAIILSEVLNRPLDRW